ncbi:MAG: hypothetical protein ACYDAM_10970 [Leptospirales bacterium]
MTLTDEQREKARIRQEKRRKGLRDAGLDGKRQLSGMISGEAFYRFERLAKYRGMSKAALLEGLIRAEHERVTSLMTQEEWERFQEWYPDGNIRPSQD